MMDATAETVLAPGMGAVLVDAVSTTANAAVDLGVQKGPGQYFTFESDVECFITFNSSSTITAPSKTATSGDARCYRIPKDGERSWKIRGDRRYFRVVAAAAGYLRYYRSGD